MHIYNPVTRTLTPIRSTDTVTIDHCRTDTNTMGWCLLRNNTVIARFTNEWRAQCILMGIARSLQNESKCYLLSESDLHRD